MNIEDLRTFCLSFPATEERLPFNPDYLVFFVHDKMFCMIDITDPHDINLKCAPERAIELRERYAEVTPGYHMNKKHWNTVRIDGSLPDSLIEEWITDSYNLVVMGLPKKVRQELSSYKNQ
ncbi:MAG: MmcQ/YjbR family DNA-binding protein [Bacteroidota bacterium]